ncbi:DNA (cytosine-5)-methyltransferase 1A [Camellia lanceoleosa]|uniref:DNA (Cytosine-5)-methyltransferase 1A n=1 Tax=Camellia lanceoleosa TaxID=1840588 RepID=A0ACC0GZZ8_9ERIC|nr:DNA (cytosine-5)-methyltransferase 1A [Camellia lanceoleosa]
MRYRLGKPAKQYSPWYEPVLKTARLVISVITLLKEQIRVSILSFSDVIMKVSEFDKDHPGYLSSNPEAIERYVVVHRQIILQQFAEFPDDTIRKCAFVTSLHDKIKERHHTKWLVKKKATLEKEANLNPRAAMAPVTSKRNAMPAKTARRINRIWAEYYSKYSPEDSKESDTCAMKEDEIEEQEEGEEEDEEEKGFVIDILGGGDLYKRAIVRASTVSVGGFALLTGDSEEYPHIYFVEYMFEELDGRKVVHGSLLIRRSQTILGNTANEREVFMTNDCLEFELADIVQTVVVEPQLMPWGYRHRKSNTDNDKANRARAVNRKSKGLPMEYFCKSVYCPDRGGFFCLEIDCMGLGSRLHQSCKINEVQEKKEDFNINSSMTGFTHMGTDNSIHDFIYLGPRFFREDGKTSENFKGGRNVGLKAYVVCHLLEIEGVKARKQADPESMTVEVRRFFRPKDISSEKAYLSDIQEDLPFMDAPVIFQHIFFCEYFYDHNNGAIKQLPAHIKLTPSKERVVGDATFRKKGKCKEGDTDFDEQKDPSSSSCLATLDIFAGCGGLSEGVSLTKWAIEYEEAAREAFNLNHPDALMIINNCNVILS